MGKKIEMPLTILYGTLATCAGAFLFFSQHLGKEEYFPTGADHMYKNRLFAQFHAEYPQHEKDRILDKTVQGMCKARSSVICDSSLWHRSGCSQH